VWEEPPAPHQVTWYIRRLAPGQRAHPEALTRAAAVGMTVPPGYTFVGSDFWPRASDPRSAADDAAESEPGPVVPPVGSPGADPPRPWWAFWRRSWRQSMRNRAGKLPDSSSKHD